MIQRKPDNLDEKDTARLVMKAFRDERRSALEARLKRTNVMTAKFFAPHFGRYSPSLFVAIRYERFKTAAANLLKFFGQTQLIKAREVTTKNAV